MQAAVVCAFCGKKTVPKVDRTVSGVAKYRCENCGSLIAAYANEYEGDLVSGKLFNKYPEEKYHPKLPSYVKKTPTRERKTSEENH